MNIEVHGTSFSPSRTCINSVGEHIVCTEDHNVLIFLNLTFTFYSLCLSRVYSLCVKFFIKPSLILSYIVAISLSRFV